MNEYERLISQGGLSLERLATLCRVADAGGLSKAAGGDASRLSLYSRQLKDLESFFGVPLTRKVGRTLTLNHAALALAAKVRGHFKELVAFGEETGAISPVISLGSSHSVFEWWLWPRLPALLKLVSKNIRIKTATLRSVDLARTVEDQGIDIALLRSDAVPRTLKTKALFVMNYSLFVPNSFKPTRKMDAQALGRIPLALSLGGKMREHIEHAAMLADVTLNIQLECPSFTLAAGAVASGEYAAILPDLSEPSFAGLPVSKLALPLGNVPSRHIVMAWHPRAPESRINAFVKALIAIRDTKGF
jgi:DNA-binding transcriptional LysR family regulator